MIGQRIGHYDILEELGRGGMGVVYRAHDTQLGRNIALKLLPSEAASDKESWLRFQREARAIASLDHPNIVTVHSFESETSQDGKDLHFITMQFVEGETLFKKIPPGGLPVRDFLTLAIPLADALASAHVKSVIHRDLKPSNIMVSSDGRPHIFDFGLAKLRDEVLAIEPEPEPPAETEPPGPFTDLTEKGRIIGTVHYMSPEQAGGQPLDCRSDLFSLGAIFYEMLTGRKPFTGDTPILVIMAILRDPPAPLTELRPDLPARLAQIILRTLEKDPNERYQTAGELKADLMAIRDELRTRDLQSRAHPRTSAFKRVLMAAVALVVLVLVFPVVRYYVLGPDEPNEPARAVPLTSMEGYELDPAVSPDGTRVAFSWQSEPGTAQDLYVRPFGSGDPLRLTEASGDNRHPAWSPDGEQIAFLRSVGGGSLEVLVIPATGGVERPIASLARVGFPGLDWSVDGKTLAFVDRAVTDRGESIHLLDTETGITRRLTRTASEGAGDRLPRFSPDGKWLAFVHWVEAQQNEVYITSTDGKELNRLVSHRGIIRGLDWLSDGSGLIAAAKSDGSTGLWHISLGGQMSQRLFGEQGTGLSIGGDKIVYSKQLSIANLWRVGGPARNEPVEAQRLAASTRDDWDPAYSPDGSKLAFVSERSGTSQIWQCRSDGEECSRIETEGFSVLPRWAPDSSRLAISNDRDGNSDLFILNSSSGFTPIRLTEHPAVDGPSNWSADGRWIYFFSDRTGQFQVWKAPAEGGPPIQVTNGSGFLAEEGEDGYLYYIRITDIWSIWRTPLPPDDPLLEEKPLSPGEQVVAGKGLGISGFALWKEHLVYAFEEDSGGLIIESLNLRTGGVRRLSGVDFTIQWAKYGRISVSPDGMWVAFPHLEGLGADLILVENFR